MMRVEQYHQVATGPQSTGDITVRVQFDADPPAPHRRRRDPPRQLSQDRGRPRRSDRPVCASRDCAGLDIGRDNGLPVGPAYSQKSPYPFTGTVKKVIFDLQPKPHQTAKRLHQVLDHAAVAAGISA